MKECLSKDGTSWQSGDLTPICMKQSPSHCASYLFSVMQAERAMLGLREECIFFEDIIEELSNIRKSLVWGFEKTLFKRELSQRKQKQCPANSTGSLREEVDV